MRCYLVCYDIRDPRRLQRVHKVLKGYGHPWQYSVFFCVLKDVDRVRLKTALEAEMNKKQDQALIIDIGSDEKAVRKATTIVGQPLLFQETGIAIV